MKAPICLHDAYDVLTHIIELTTFDEIASLATNPEAVGLMRVVIHASHCQAQEELIGHMVSQLSKYWMYMNPIILNFNKANFDRKNQIELSPVYAVFYSRVKLFQFDERWLEFGQKLHKTEIAANVSGRDHHGTGVRGSSLK
jgi:hypothetical protein